MSGLRETALAALAAASSCCVVMVQAPRGAADDGPTWNGQYVVTFGANAKTGTSIAASGPEFAHRANYSFSSSCAAGVCIATVTDGPPAKNEFIQRPIEYTWNGSQWVRETTWKWDCLLPDGTIEYDPAKSIAVYTPGPHGILTGVFHTDITSGACKGNVDMPVSAKPAFEPESVV
ncbi:hypothetical protein [Mycobacterium persicum]|uniref:Secreted protein n=1 Tax=Mycobacterium persicum TaxID=1487726 RepID=A0AB38UVF0_9MYCO|nr:hypothetical protein [Mycobacterium persicum]ORB37739.1 hypothetical protein BST40_23515 [Mycobacterium persicum]ORB88442.1 hypothetical protein B1T49_03125 [Mycobacterium persicum]ORC00488.1 hypothetical protein B1T48_03060 [Mycobacterium persicum]VAZ84493.1 hypothetical protein LAUMK42_03316 [Mycobacterium persicum]